MVLVDSSVWIEYFKGAPSALSLNLLIDSNNICINDLILAELIPSINHRKENRLSELLLAVTKIPIDIKWNHLVYMQTENLRKGINRVGIADLIIAQNVLENDLELFALDSHFQLMSELHGVRMYKQ